jgi:signal transduction histidine kinase
VQKSLVERFRWPGADALPGEPAPTRAVIARTFAYLYGAGGLLALATLLLPHGPGRSTLGVAAPAVAALLVAALTTFVPDRLPFGFFRWLPLLGTVLASCVMLSGDPWSTVPYTGFYFWVVLSSFYLFEARWAWINVAVVAVALTVVLVLSPSVEDRALAWAMVMGSLAVGGGMIGLLRRRLEDVAAQSQRALARTLESERALAEAQRIAQVGSWQADLLTGGFRGSAEFFRIIGLDQDAVSTVEEVMGGLGADGGDRCADAIRAGLDGDGEVELELEVDLPRLGPRVLATRAWVVRGDDGTARRVLGTTHDVTEQRAQDARLQRTLRRLRATIDIGLALGRDPDRLLRLISERAQSLLGADAVYIRLTDDAPPTSPGARTGELHAPLAYRGATHGVLVAVPPAGGSFTSEDEEMLRAFASSAATAVAGMQMVQEDALRRSIEAAEPERARVARELHDQTLQALGALMMMLEAPHGEDGEALRRATRSAAIHIGDEIENLRRIIADLRPTYLDSLGLTPAVEALVERVREEHGIDVREEIDPVPALEPAAEQTIYRVVQEGLTNVCKHAMASHARVVVRCEDDVVVVRVEDDGRGFDKARVGGFGLIGMRERLGLLGATLNVESGPDGTVLDARVPLAHG